MINAMWNYMPQLWKTIWISFNTYSETNIITRH